MLHRFAIIQKVRFKDIQVNNLLNFILRLSLVNGHYYSLIISKTDCPLRLSAVSHIPQFGDAVSPAGDLLASPNFEICDTTQDCHNILFGSVEIFHPFRCL